MVRAAFSLVRTTGFLVMLCISLATTAISMAVWAASLTGQIATVTASAAASALGHSKAITTLTTGAKAKTAALVAQHRQSLAALRTRMTIQRKKAVAKAVVRTKAKARLRRIMVAIPLVGIAAAGWFEHGNYQEWKSDNPDGELGDYGCEVSTISAEVIDEVLQELPEKVRPSRDLVLGRLPKCEANQ